MVQRLETIKAELRKLPFPPPSCHYSIRSEHLTVPDNVVIFPSYDLSARSFHQRYVLMICLQPAGTVLVDDRPFQLRPGEGILVFPRQRHSYAHLQDTDILWLVLTFDLREEGDVHLLRDTPIRLSRKCQRELKELLLCYQRKQDDILGNNEVVLRTAWLLNELKANRLAASSRTDSADHQRLIYNVGVFIHDHIHEPFTVMDIADSLNISESYLRCLFRGSVGLSLGKYITVARIRKAVGLLAHTNMSVTHIAGECGFTSLSAFSRTFRSHAKMSPLAFRHKEQASTQQSKKEKASIRHRTTRRLSKA